MQVTSTAESETSLSWRSFLEVSFELRVGTAKRSEEQQEQMVFLKRVPETAVCMCVCVWGDACTASWLGGSRAGPQHCPGLFLSTPCCRLQVWQGKCAVIITQGQSSCSTVESIVRVPRGNKQRKGPIKAFPAHRSHVLPLILLPESICLPQACVPPCPLFQRTEWSFLGS